MKCPRCKKNDLEYFDGDFRTGVVSDGFRESQYQRGWYCSLCQQVIYDLTPSHDPDHWNPAEGGNRLKR